MAGDPHRRFGEWLLTGTTAEPPRDLALHASVCPDCRRVIAAFDLLSDIDPGRAPLPRANALERPLPVVLRAARVLGAAAGVAILGLVVGVGVGSALQLSDETGTGPEQGVLGATGVPAASASADAAATNAPTAAERSRRAATRSGTPDSSSSAPAQ